jgi:hypothetical protein
MTWLPVSRSAESPAIHALGFKRHSRAPCFRCAWVLAAGSLLRSGWGCLELAARFSSFCYVSLYLEDCRGIFCLARSCWRGVRGTKIGFLRLHGAIASGRGVFGRPVSCQAKSGSWLSGFKMIRARESFMEPKQMNVHFAFASCCIP